MFIQIKTILFHYLDFLNDNISIEFLLDKKIMVQISDSSRKIFALSDHSNLSRLV